MCVASFSDSTPPPPRAFSCPRFSSLDRHYHCLLALLLLSLLSLSGSAGARHRTRPVSQKLRPPSMCVASFSDSTPPPPRAFSCPGFSSLDRHYHCLLALLLLSLLSLSGSAGARHRTRPASQKLRPTIDVCCIIFRFLPASAARFQLPWVLLFGPALSLPAGL